MTWETVVGLEVHAQLLTQTKLFCGCSTEFGAEANHHVCPVCLGLPGSLPVMNEKALGLAVKTALALGCQVHETSVFARKNYFYPDLPKGYQISQYERPFSTEGGLTIETEAGSKRVGIERVHMEEDAGKNLHGVGADSIVDLNRAGVPLVEIVGKPDLRSSAEAAAYLKALREVLVFAGVNDGNLEEGSFRCDANVSIRRPGEKLGTRVELKNLNSFRFVARAIDSEVTRQRAVLEGGGTVAQETRSFDPDTGQTRLLRSKEQAHDYRYFPEPDLPPLEISPALIDQMRDQLPELPLVMRERWQRDFGISAQSAATLGAHPEYARFFEETVRRGADPHRAASWIQTELLRSAVEKGLSAVLSVSPAQLAELIALVDKGEISGKQAKEVFAAIEGSARLPSDIVKERGLEVIGDSGTLEPLCRRIVDAHPKQADAVRGGKKGVMGFFVGQVMKETGGSADPKLVTEILERLLA